MTFLEAKKEVFNSSSAADGLLENCRGRKGNVNERGLCGPASEKYTKWKDNVLHVRIHYGGNALMVCLGRTIIYSLEY